MSILLVFLSHAGLGHIVPGGLGVTVFFFISGYLITVLMLREWEATGRLALRAFWLRRALRLGPPLALALGLAILLSLAGLTASGTDPATLAAQVFFISNYYIILGFGQPIPGTGVLWSLAVEEHFYLAWPLLFPLFAARRLGLRWLGIGLLAFLAWRALRFYLFDASEDEIYYLSDTRLDSLLFGCTLALFQARGLLPRMQRPMLWIGAGLALILLSLVIRSPEMRAVWRFSLQGIGLLPIFHLAVTRPQLAIFRPLNWAWVRWVGLWSYSFYLVHHVILESLAHSFPSWAQTLLWALVSAGLALSWAALVHRFVERPMAALRRKLRMG